MRTLWRSLHACLTTPASQEYNSGEKEAFRAMPWIIASSIVIFIKEIINAIIARKKKKKNCAQHKRMNRK
jgi:hypothetical protein